MFRITKVLNHNTVLAVKAGGVQEYLILGKGIGFGKKVSEQFEPRQEDTAYELTNTKERGHAKDIVKSISPEFLEISDRLLAVAEQQFGEIDRNILFPMADHIAFAVQRIQKGESISNPLTEDIQLLFHQEYKVAEHIRPLLKRQMDIEIDDDEVGYVALHIHAALQDAGVSEAMQTAAAVRKCISMIEKEIGKAIQVTSLSYNRLMNHIRYMVARVMSGEELKVNMNDYMAVKFPKAFQMAEQVCEQLGKELKYTFQEVEIGYLAMHIERVTCEELGIESE